MKLDSREWLEPDGLGGYAMGTACGVRTRRYHSLLASATRPPVGRMVLVNGLEAFVETHQGRQALSSHRYRNDVVWPDGASRIIAFVWNPWPSWVFRLDDETRVAQDVLVAPGAPRVFVRWRLLEGPGAVRLWVRPLLSGRDHHALHRENPEFRFDAQIDGARVTWRPYPGVPAIVALSNGNYRHEPDWYRGFVYSEEEARGLDSVEDLASPGSFAFDLTRDGAALAFSADGLELEGGDVLALWGRAADVEAGRRARFASPLHRAADAYVVARGTGTTVVAGYPWFTDWGRDTFIALRGLCLCTGRYDQGREVLVQWARALSAGMLPNQFPEGGNSPEYNSVDASLWFVLAADSCLAAAATCPATDRRAIEDAIDAIAEAYAAGTRHGIVLEPDGLLACGEPGVQLTWMDAKVGDRVVTPRVGKPVEVQALWANALAIAARRHARWRKTLERAREAFAQRFWNPERRMLYDVVDCDHRPGVVDAAFRPNQIFAVGGGLPLALLEGERARAVVDAVERELWTPVGLRSLAPGEPGYRPFYRGGPAERDGAYHQGTVWTWLAGPFIEAWIRVRGGTAEARHEARRRFFRPLLNCLDDRGLGHLGEIADAMPPHETRGCPFQAWSVAEALRLEMDVLR